MDNSRRIYQTASSIVIGDIIDAEYVKGTVNIMPDMSLGNIYLGLPKSQSTEKSYVHVYVTVNNTVYEYYMHVSVDVLSRVVTLRTSDKNQTIICDFGINKPSILLSVGNKTRYGYIVMNQRDKWRSILMGCKYGPTTDVHNNIHTLSRTKTVIGDISDIFGDCFTGNILHTYNKPNEGYGKTLKNNGSDGKEVSGRKLKRKVARNISIDDFVTISD